MVKFGSETDDRQEDSTMWQDLMNKTDRIRNRLFKRGDKLPDRDEE